MESNISGEVEQEKIRQSRFQVIHRWTDLEISRLLESILTFLRTEPNTFFECPTAKRFYERLRKDYFTEGDFDLIALKSKMHHLKKMYIKARDWEKNVGSELYMSDQNYVNTTKKKMCPFYDLLDKIFNANLNADPISFQRLHSNENTSDFLKSMKKLIKNRDRPEILVETNEEIKYDDHFIVDKHEQYADETLNTSIDDFANHKKAKNSVSTLSLEEKRFQLKKQKFKLYCKFEARRISLENRKYKYEKEKFQREQEIREYEIKKQIEIKKLEIETNQRLKLLEKI